MTVGLANISVTYPPVIRTMLVKSPSPQQYNPQSGRYEDGPELLDVHGIVANVKAMHDHMAQQKFDLEEVQKSVANQFADMETRLRDAMSLMYYTVQFHPQIVNDWRVTEATKKRIGVTAEDVQDVYGP